jgi:hypothetical protein
VVAKIRERLAVNKQGSHKFHMERFNIKQLNEVEGKEKYRVEVSNRFAALEDLIQEEIKRRLNSGNACYHSVQNLLSSCLLSNNVKVRIYKTIILPVVLYVCETWSLTVREEHGLTVFENKVLRRIFGTKRDGVMGGWRKLPKEELHNLYSSAVKLQL